MIVFIVGVLVGANLGVIIIALMFAAKENEDQYCEYCIYFDEPMECEACQDCFADIRTNFVRKKY